MPYMLPTSGWPAVSRVWCDLTCRDGAVWRDLVRRVAVFPVGRRPAGRPHHADPAGMQACADCREPQSRHPHRHDTPTAAAIGLFKSLSAPAVCPASQWHLEETNGAVIV